MLEMVWMTLDASGKTDRETTTTATHTYGESEMKRNAHLAHISAQLVVFVVVAVVVVVGFLDKQAIKAKHKQNHPHIY